MASSDQQMRVTIFALLRLTFRVLICCFVLFFKLTELLQWYAATFRDPMMLQPPEWFKAFIYCEAFLQMPFFPIAVYAFLKGGCKWIRTPAIIYSTHVATTLFAILAHILFHDFSKSEHLGPQTQPFASWSTSSIKLPTIFWNSAISAKKRKPSSKVQNTPEDD
uniref:Transmembrane protein 97 n=1 Tax=Buteo japonicus TaxID=224669 RepID=A0A8C0BBH5_9AVES